MEEYFRKGKRRPTLAHKQYPAAHGPLRPPPRARVPAPLSTHDLSAARRTSSTTTTTSAGNTTTPSATVTITAPPPGTRPTRAPRKRFRKKVTGLFGEQSDLQKRMQKLLRPLTEDILLKKQQSYSDTSPNVELDQVKMSADTLGLAKQVVDELDKRNEDRIKPAPDVVVSSMSARALASIAKWKKFSNRIGRMSPRSNELFLNEVEVCSPCPSETKEKDRYDPPSLPSLDKTLSPRTITNGAGSRMGTPAMLRRKVRRNERGYRGSDVLRMRSGKTGISADSNNAGVQDVGNSRHDAVSPAVIRRGVTPSGGLDCYVRSLGGDGVLVARRSRSELVSDGRQPMPRRARSDATQDVRRSAPKRRRVSDECSSSETHQRQIDAFSLLIEAAEKESNTELPPRKAKRLRSSGCMTSSEESSPPRERTERRHTTIGLTEPDYEIVPQAIVRGRGDGRIRAERGSIMKRKRTVAAADISQDMEVDSAATADEKTDNEE